jgi:flagellar biosynthesis protein FlhB
MEKLKGLIIILLFVVINCILHKKTNDDNDGSGANYKTILTTIVKMTLTITTMMIMVVIMIKLSGYLQSRHEYRKNEIYNIKKYISNMRKTKTGTKAKPYSSVK